MIRQIHITHFRSFQHLQIDDLSRINVMVGPNAAGKTALLEAIFLAAGGTPEVTLRLRNWRGLGERLTLSRDKRNLEGLWKDLFYNFATFLRAIKLNPGFPALRTVIVVTDSDDDPAAAFRIVRRQIVEANEFAGNAEFFRQGR